MDSREILNTQANLEILREREMKQNRTRPEYLTTKVIDSKTLEALLQYPPNS
jgi:hypothetical protein